MKLLGERNRSASRKVVEVYIMKSDPIKLCHRFHEEPLCGLVVGYQHIIRAAASIRIQVDSQFMTPCSIEHGCQWVRGHTLRLYSRHVKLCCGLAGYN